MRRDADQHRLLFHRLLFHRPVPGAARTAAGYALGWQGAALMGVLNVTPDSFSDAGRFMDPDRALAQARRMREAGALIIDVGGESTRPGAEEVAAELEIDRVRPVIRRLGELEVVVSIDTSKAEVAEAALDAGAHLVNDVRGLREPGLVALLAVRGVPAVVMHMQGEPRTMQSDPRYDDVVGEVRAFLAARAEAALAAGLPSVVIDPGLGFGKTLAHNLELLRRLDALVALGHPVLVGASRKGTIALIAGPSEPSARDPGSLALHLYAAERGAALLRVHNVAAHAQALAVWRALSGERDEG